MDVMQAIMKIWGYKIPKYLDKRNNCFRVKNGTKIVVKINDLSFGSSAKVDVECDYCRKRYITENVRKAHSFRGGMDSTFIL